MIVLLSLLCVAALLNIRGGRHEGVYPPAVLVLMAVAICVLTFCLIYATDRVFLENTGGTQSPWSDWGVRLGS